VSKFYRFSAKSSPEEEKDFTVMSYNVRLFNLYDWLPQEGIADSISAFAKENNPDVLCVQEFSKKGEAVFTHYRHHFIFYKPGVAPQAIFSKFPIIDKGNIEFPDSGNSVIYADIKRGNDTLRVYSMHLQ